MRSDRVWSIDPGSAALSTAWTILLAGCPGEAQQATGEVSNLADGAGPPLLRVTSDGCLINEIVSLPRDENAGVSINLEDRVLYYRVPFRVGPVWSVAADGQLIALLTHEGDAGPNRFRVHAFGSDGGERRPQLLLRAGPDFPRP